MDEARRQILMSELDDALKERSNLTAYIHVLASRLGVTVDEAVEGADPGAASNGAAAPTPAPGQDPVALIFEGELIGKSLPKAAAEVIRRYSPDPHKRPIKTPVLVEALQKGGLDVKSARQLYRSLYNSTALRQIKGGQWGFATWYPDLPKTKTKGTESEPETSVVEGATTDGEEFASTEGGAS